MTSDILRLILDNSDISDNKICLDVYIDEGHKSIQTCSMDNKQNERNFRPFQYPCCDQVL